MSYPESKFFTCQGSTWQPSAHCLYTMSITHIQSISQLDKILSSSKEKLSVCDSWCLPQILEFTSLDRSLTSMLHGLIIQDLEHSDVLMYFRCGPCHMIAPAFEALSKKYTNVNFLKCDVDAARDVAARYSISAM